MRCFVLPLVVILASLITIQTKQPIVKKGNRNLETHKAQDKKDSESAAPVGSRSQEGAPKAESEKHRSSDPPDERIYKVDVVSQPRNRESGWFIVYVIITGIIATASAISTFAVWSQRRILQSTAEAALLNARAVINAERAWVVPKITKQESFIDEQSPGGRGRQRRVVYFTFSISNIGKTPARIDGVMAQALPNTGGTSGGLTDPPDYRNMPTYTVATMLGPGDERVIPDISLEIWRYPPTTQTLIEQFKEHIILKGVITYRDVIRPKEIHVSRFCYTYFTQLEEYRSSGPPGHTEYT